MSEYYYSNEEASASDRLDFLIRKLDKTLEKSEYLNRCQILRKIENVYLNTANNTNSDLMISTERIMKDSKSNVLEEGREKLLKKREKLKLILLASENSISDQKLKMDFRRIYESLLSERDIDKRFLKNFKYDNRMRKIDRIQNDLDFNFYKFINMTYHLAISNMGKPLVSFNNEPIKEDNNNENHNIFFSLPIEEDKSWKNIEKNDESSMQIILHRDNLIQNTQPNYQFEQPLNALLERTYAFYLNNLYNCPTEEFF